MSDGKCLRCGKKLEDRERKYCSMECYQLHIQETPHACAYCGEPFVAKTSRNIYCSKYCANRGLLERKRAEEPKSKCAWCGKAFKKVHKKRYCSEKCRITAGNRNYRERLNKESTVCKGCGVMFVPQKNGQIYCGVKGCKADRLKTVKGQKTVRIRITKRIPVFPELQPKVGRIYEAVPNNKKPGESSFYVIPDINGKAIVVRSGECVEVN